MMHIARLGQIFGDVDTIEADASRPIQRDPADVNRCRLKLYHADLSCHCA
jgi:hypothetical protein